MKNLLSKKILPDWEAFVNCIRRKATPKRVHNIELFLDGEIQEAVCKGFNLSDGLDSADPFFWEKRQIRMQRFLGYDYVTVGLENLDFQLAYSITEDTAANAHADGRPYIDESKGPITNWEEFEKYPWPDLKNASSRALEWYQKNLPDDMCLIGGGAAFGHPAEYLSWLMGYETLCYALFDNRELVKAIHDKIFEISVPALEQTLAFDRVKIVWGSDDMGFKTGTLISPADLREFVLPMHKILAEICHEKNVPYILHSCGNLNEIMDDLIEDVKIDAKHSFEDTIEFVTDAKEKYGDKIALLGGIDVDFLCNADEPAIRNRVRETLDKCLPGGGYCLGTGNSVANYIPVENYLIMLDEGRNWRA